VHDGLHDAVAHDIALVEAHELHALDVREDAVGFFEARDLPLREVDLRDVARHDGLAAEPEAREEHLHLLGRRVLGFIEDHEGVVERTTTHEGERRDLDDVALEHAADFFVAEDVVKRIVQRAQVRVHLFGEVARKEAELLARLDRGAGKDDALDLLLEQRGSGHRDGEIGLDPARRPDREFDVVLENRLQILLRADVPRGDVLAKRRPDGAVFEQVDERGGRLFLQDADRRLEVRLFRRVTALDELRKIRKEPRRESRALRVARNGDLAPARGDLDAEGVFEEPKVFVVDTEERAESRLGKGERDGVRSDLVRSLDKRIEARGPARQAAPSREASFAVALTAE